MPMIDGWRCSICKKGESRAYWSRAHELTHRIAEPPQYRLPFYRHRDDRADRLESLIDKTAAELAFYPTLLRPIIDCISTDPLSWELVDRVRELYAPSASRHATANAVLRFWPHPAFLLKARIAGRKRRPGIDRALRIKLMGFSSWDSEYFVLLRKYACALRKPCPALFPIRRIYAGLREARQLDNVIR